MGLKGIDSRIEYYFRVVEHYYVKEMKTIIAKTINAVADSFVPFALMSHKAPASFAYAVAA